MRERELERDLVRDRQTHTQRDIERQRDRDTERYIQINKALYDSCAPHRAGRT